jgi:ATP-dependent DNA ligase
MTGKPERTQLGEGLQIRPYPDFPSARSSDGNYVASVAVPCVFLAGPHRQRHITPNATEEVKLDGHRAVAVKNGGTVRLWSRNRKSLNCQFPQIAEALKELPDGTVIDGEVVAMGDDGRPNFNLLQNFKSEAKRIRFFVFDLFFHQNRGLTRLDLVRRRELLNSLKFTDSRVIRLAYLEAFPQDMLAAVRAQGLEGVIAKRKDSVYEPGNAGQEFVVSGYIPGGHGVDSIIVGSLPRQEADLRGASS